MKRRYLRPTPNMPEIYLYRAPVDFRKQANGLALLVEQALGTAPLPACSITRRWPRKSSSGRRRRRKFVEASKTAQSKGKKAVVAKADIALSHINKLYVIERHRIRQELSLPRLHDLKTWVETHVRKVAKDSLTRKAMEYTLNQWKYLMGYCDRGDLHISNILAENAIRPFAVGRKAWLFADTTQGTRASATYYSLIETAKANGLEPSVYIQYVLNHIAEADTLEKLERLLPWNAELERTSEKVTQLD